MHTSRRTLSLLLLDEHRKRKRRGGARSVAPASATTYVSDSFDRADGAIGTADSGQLWTDPASVWAVSAFLARITSAASPRIAYIDSGQADGVFRLTLSVAGVAGLMLRRVDASNYLATAVATGTIRLRRITGGVVTNIGTGGAAASGDTVRVVANGDQITVYLNDVEQFTATEGQGQASTEHGLYSTQTAPRHNDYSHQSS